MNIDRRQCLTIGLTSAISTASASLLAQQGDKEERTKPLRPEPQRGPRQDLALVQAFVQAGHADRNLARVQEYLSQDPKLVLAAWDWGGGDWETALGGASHTGSREMARYLLSQGARIDTFCAAMLGERQVVAALVASDPSVVAVKGPHGYTLLYHAAISGDVAIAEILKPHLGSQPRLYSQALTAAVRDGHLAMTRWLFANGDADPNAEDALGKRPLTTALEKGFQEVAQELRRHGARGAD
jgi:hypothetical protein